LSSKVITGATKEISQLKLMVDFLLC